MYFDNAATTKPLPEVITQLHKIALNNYANASSAHKFGQQSARLLTDAKQAILHDLDAKTGELIFTSGATEANNLILRSICPEIKSDQAIPHLIISAIEHSCIIETAKFLAKQGVKVTKLPVSSQGLVDPNTLKAALTPQTYLVSIMSANNEIGTLQPLTTIGKIINDYRQQMNSKVIFHSDMSQSFPYLNTKLDDIPALDTISLSAHKFHALTGTGLLFTRKKLHRKIQPQIFGGGQQNNKRSGTINLSGILGMALASQITRHSLEQEYNRIIKLRNELLHTITTNITGVTLNGSLEQRLPNNLNLSFTDINGEALLFALSTTGIFISTGSACASTHDTGSYVLQALGLSPAQIAGSIRISIGRNNTAAEVKILGQAIIEKVKYLRALNN